MERIPKEAIIIIIIVNFQSHQTFHSVGIHRRGTQASFAGECGAGTYPNAPTEHRAKLGAGIPFAFLIFQLPLCMKKTLFPKVL